MKSQPHKKKMFPLSLASAKKSRWYYKSENIL